MKTPRGLYIVASDPGSEGKAPRHQAAFVDVDKVAGLELELERLISTFEKKTRLRFKLVGARAMILKCAQALKKKCLKLDKTVIRELPMELHFDESTGIVRVSREKIRVLIADDSPTIRKLLERVLTSDPEIEVVASIGQPTKVEQAIAEKHPHVITLDLHMPEMDGVTLLKSMMPKFRIPTVVISSISMEEGPLVLSALENGALDYVQKPSMEELGLLAPVIIEKIKTAAHSNLSFEPYHKLGGKLPEVARVSIRDPGSRLIAIGSSTGGTEALKEVLTRLPANIPPILIVQHIPPVFSKAFADRMNSLCPFEVKEAENGDAVIPGRVLIAPGATQMSLRVEGGKWTVAITDDPPVNRHKPSVDVLFNSVAKQVAKQTICVILTGMGGDGAKGMLEARKAGSRTIAQDEPSCAVFGMPREAIRLGAVERVCPLLEIPSEIGSLLEGRAIRASG